MDPFPHTSNPKPKESLRASVKGLKMKGLGFRAQSLGFRIDKQKDQGLKSYCRI